MSNTPTTEELLEELQLLIRGLDSEELGFWSRGYARHNLDLLVWKSFELGNLSFTDLMIDLGFMTEITMENYIRDLEEECIYGLGEPEIVEKCNQLTNIIKNEFDDFEAYAINSKVDNGLCYPYYNSFKIAIGRTETSNYIGISPSLSIIEKKIFGKELVRFFEEVQQEDFYLKQKISSISRDLILPIKSEFDNIQNLNNIVEIYSSKDVLIEQILQKSNAIKVSYFHYFEDEGLEDEGLEKYLDLNIFIQKYLKNIKLYEIGFYEYIYIYIIGETPTGDWLGISTKASEGH